MRRFGLMAGMVLCLGFPAAAGAASPSVTTGGATSVKNHSAVLNATINPGGRRTVYVFQYGPTTAYGAQTATKSAGSGTTNVAVKTGISKLTSGTVYHYRVVATNSQGMTIGKDRQFKTTGQPPAPPGVFTGGATQRNLHGATLTGIVASVKSPATYRFQFGLTPAYGIETTSLTVPAQPFPQPVSFALSGLQAHRIYHYRIVATNKDGTAVGGDQLFITGAVRPGPVTRNTRKRHLNGRRWALTTAGRLKIPRGFPIPQSCTGTVRVRFLIGRRIVRSLNVPLGGDCKYSVSTVISAARGGTRLRVAALFRGNALLLRRSGLLQVVRIG
jgi:phosphodiesterase/alkaline phosphatase D-like protein